MRYKIDIQGLTPVIQHNGDIARTSPFNVEKETIIRKKAAQRTEDDEERLRELETLLSMYVEKDQVTMPIGAFRKALETAARKLKQGTQVREGMIVESVAFTHEHAHLGDVMEIARAAMFSAPVFVQGKRIERVRAKFDDWSAVVVVDCDESLIDQFQLETWVGIAGKRIGVGDWRPEKSGTYGRFSAEVTALD